MNRNQNNRIVRVQRRSKEEQKKRERERKRNDKRKDQERLFRKNITYLEPDELRKSFGEFDEDDALTILERKLPLHQTMVDLMFTQNVKPIQLQNLLKVIQFLTENLGDGFLNVRDRGQDTVLHRAAYMDVPGLVPYLVEHGASLIEENRRGFTPLQAAVTKKQEGNFKYLLEKGSTFFPVISNGMHEEEAFQKAVLRVPALSDIAYRIHWQMGMAVNSTFNSLVRVDQFANRARHSAVMTVPLNFKEATETKIKFRLHSSHVHEEHCGIEHVLVLFGMTYQRGAFAVRREAVPFTRISMNGKWLLDYSIKDRTTYPGFFFCIRPKEVNELYIRKNVGELGSDMIAMTLFQYEANRRSCNRNGCFVAQNMTTQPGHREDWEVGFQEPVVE
ncbi:hypothetical protein CRE_05974 [Caenorhabditis remanei]|uniref:Uncharacterized protein n=1 Tax=Caenorhabditis remanei TaxID=31234 RepID=E3MZC0_CAERE|nr:hypothetical protein CRE_05974 [Caenorhabditis remanei]